MQYGPTAITKKMLCYQCKGIKDEASLKDLHDEIKAKNQ